MARTRQLSVVFTGDAASLNRAFRASEEAAAKFGTGVEKANIRATKSTEHVATQTEHFHTRMRKSWHGVTTSAGGYVAAMVGAAGVIEGLKKSVDAAQSAEAAQGQLQQTVKTAGITWRAHSKQLEDYVVAARRAKGFTDTDLEKSLTGNIRTTKSLAEAQKLTNAAMDVARGRGEDLASAQQQLGRVFLGNSKAIKALGISFTPTKQAQDALAGSTESGNRKLQEQAKALDLAHNRTTALAAIQKQYAGDSAKYADTTAGKFAKFHAQLEATEVTIGTALLPVLGKLATDGEKAALAVEKHWPQIKKDVQDVVRPVEHVAEALFSFGKAHPDIAKIAGSLTVAALAVHKIDQHTGAFSLLAKGAKGLLFGGGGAAGGGGLVGKITGKAAGAPVYVTNWEMIRGGGGAGGSVVKDIEKGATRGGIAGLAAKVAGVAGVGAIAGTAGFLGYKGITDDDAKMARFIHGVYAKIGADRAKERQDSAKTRDAVINDFERVGGHVKSYSQQVADAQGKVTSDFKQMGLLTGSSLKGIRDATDRTSSDIKDTLGTKSQAGKDALVKNFSLAAAAVQQNMDAAGHATRTGMSQITRYLNDELRTLGWGKQQIKDFGPSGTFTGVESARGRATGGWIGTPGMAGGDNIPIMVGAGEAVVNRHQQAPIEVALRSTFGVGLDDLFSTVTRPHYMAKGGRVGNIGAMESAAHAIDRKHYPYKWGGGHGSFSGPFDCSGAISAVLHAGGLLDKPMVSGDLANWGLPGPGPVTVYANPVHTYMHLPDGWFGTSGQNPGGGAGYFAGGPRPGFAVRHAPAMSTGIKRVKWSGPGGEVGTIGQGVLDRARGAANRSVNRALRGMISGGSYGGGNAGDAGSAGFAKGTLNFGQLSRLASSVGLPGDLFAHIAEAESGGRPTIVNSIGATGLWQIYNHPDLVKRFGSMKVPLHNAQAAKVLYDQSGLAPWVSSRASWGRYAGSRFASGGFVGGRFAKGGFIRGRIAMSGGGDPIGQFIGGLTPKPPKAGPKPKAAPKPVEGLNPNNNKREWHTPAVWRDIRIRYQQAHHGQHAQVKAAPLVTDINPVTGKEEKHTAAQWHTIHLRYREDQARIKRQDAAITRITGIPSQDVTAQIALQTVENRGDLPGQLDIDEALLQSDQSQLRKINKALRNPKLTKRQRAGLLAGKLAILQDEGSLKGDIGTTKQSIADLKTGTGADTPDTTAQDAATQALAENTQAIKDMKAALDANTKTANTALGIGYKEALRFMADMLSGQVVGRVPAMAQAAGNGAGPVTRY